MPADVFLMSFFLVGEDEKFQVLSYLTGLHCVPLQQALHFCARRDQLLGSANDFI